MGLRAKAMKGDAAAAKLYFMLVYDWNEKNEINAKVEHTIKLYSFDAKHYPKKKK
jgi:hypothetical protein